jgi:methylenetetrahydrofolate dehydrogenase (NADP+)/methenyltetrahydrofolate cyclohydrolase
VQREGEHRRVGLQQLGGAVALVHVAVDDRDRPERGALAAQLRDRDRKIVEEAVPAPRRPARVVRPAAKVHAVAGGHRVARRLHRALGRSTPALDELGAPRQPQHPLLAVAQPSLAHALEVRALVYAGEQAPVGRPRGADVLGAREPLADESFAQQPVLAERELVPVRQWELVLIVGPEAHHHIMRAEPPQRSPASGRRYDAGGHGGVTRSVIPASGAVGDGPVGRRRVRMAAVSALIIDGKAIGAAQRAAIKTEVAAFVAEHGRAPGLATVLVGEDPASQVYVANKHRGCEEAGMISVGHVLPADSTQAEVEALIDELNADDTVDGILCQLPVPEPLDGGAISQRVSADKDVDGLTVASAGRLALGVPGLRPCTPRGCMVLLEEAGVDLTGKHAVVVGRSNLFGKPMAQLLLQANATVTMAHSRTADLAAVCREADVLVVAVGQPELVRGDWIKPGATVIDVGMNRLESGLVGDVAFEEAREVAGAITPVPGGVGPMTIAMLLANTLDAARAAEARRAG